MKELKYFAIDDVVPFKKWYGSLKDITLKVRVLRRIQSLSEGNPGDCKSVGDGVHELRIKIGPGYRIYFGNDGEKIVILLCAGSKKTQTKDIAIAKEYWKLFKEGKEND